MYCKSKILLIVVLTLVAQISLSSSRNEGDLAQKKLNELLRKLGNVRTEIKDHQKNLEYLLFIKDKLYENCIYNLLTHYDEEFKTSSYGAVLLNSLMYWYNNQNDSIEDNLKNIKSIHRLCKNPKEYQLDFPKEHVPYTFSLNKESEKKLVDTSNFDKEIFEQSLYDVQEDLEVKNPAFKNDQQDLNVMTKLIKIYHQELYDCKFIANVQLTLLAGSGANGQVKCTDALGGKYRWMNAIQGEYFTGINVSISIGKKYNYQMTKDETSGEKVKGDTTFFSGLLMGDIEDSNGKLSNHFSLGLGGGDNIKYSIKTLSQKKLETINLKDLKYSLIFKGEVTDEDRKIWINLRDFIHSPVLIKRVNIKLNELNNSRLNLEQRISSIKDKMKAKAKNKKSKKKK